MSHSNWARVVALFVVLFVGAPALAADDGRVVAIQQRKYRIAHEIIAGGTFEPLDAFSKGLAAEVGYVWHWSDRWAWEVAKAGYVTRFDTGLATQLKDQFGVAPTQFENLKFFAGTALIYKPTYGKLAFHDASIVHVETFVSLGLNVGRFDTSLAAAPELGVGFRLYLSKSISLRFEARDALYVSRKLTNVVFLSSALSFAFGGTDG